MTIGRDSVPRGRVTERGRLREREREKERGFIGEKEGGTDEI